MKRILLRSWLIWLILLLLPVGLTVFSAVYATDGESWALHKYNPRVYRRGFPATGIVTDRNGVVLRNYGAGSYSEDTALRQSVLHWVGDVQGNIPAAAISHYARQIAGYDRLDGLYSYANAEAQITLTLCSDMQKAALEALRDYAGTVAVCNYKTGEILCAVSRPGFDPLQPPALPQNGEYMNRFIQGRYTPGSVFKLVTTAAILEEGDMSAWHYTCKGSHTFGTEKVTCPRAHGKLDLKEALLRSCNCAYAQLSTELGAEKLQGYASRFGVLEPVSFDGLRTAKGNMELSGGASALAWSAIGQHKDLINPCAFLCFVGAIANGGRRVQPYLVKTVSREYRAQKNTGDHLVSQATAEQLQKLMRNNVTGNYGADNFPGFTVCAKTGTAEVAPGEKPHALFVGFLQEEAYPYAFFILAENAGSGKKICVPILARLLEAIKNTPSA